MDVEDHYHNFLNSKFYQILSKIENEREITEIENLDSFIKEYETYINELEIVNKVKIITFF